MKIRGALILAVLAGAMMAVLALADKNVPLIP
jgi:hypothetical protein